MNCNKHQFETRDMAAHSMPMRHRWFLYPVLIACAVSIAYAQNPVPSPIHGLTVDDKNDVRDPAFRAKLLDSLTHLSVKPTVRIVYTPGNESGYFPAKTYLEASKQIKSAAYVFGQPMDSFYMRCLTPTQHLARFKDYAGTLGDTVDIWEVANEVNGEWLFGNTRDCSPKATVKSTSQADVVTKMADAYDYLHAEGKVTALTLYYNTPCHRPNANEMFHWAETNVPGRMKSGLDYLLVSYYELDCNGHRPDWESVFQRLAAVFPNSKLGFSEFGWSEAKPNDALVKDLIRRTYAVHPSVPNWVGGGFYWEFAIDAVPYDPSPDSFWSTINSALANQR